MSNTIKINKSVPESISKDSSMLKAMAVFYSMKFLYKGGIIKNITGRYDEIAGAIGISGNNLRQKVKRLEKEGLVRKVGRDLYFLGFNAITEKFNGKTKKSYKIDHCGAKELEIKLKALAICVNIEKQEFVLQEKIIELEMKKFGKIEAKGTRKKIKRHIRKNYSSVLNKHSKRKLFSNTNRIFNQNINTEVTITRMGMANMFGRVSKSSGTRLVKNLKRIKIIEKDDKRIELVHRKMGKSAIRHLELDSSFFVFKGSLYKRLANLIEVTRFFA